MIIIIDITLYLIIIVTKQNNENENKEYIFEITPQGVNIIQTQKPIK